MVKRLVLFHLVMVTKDWFMLLLVIREVILQKHMWTILVFTHLADHTYTIINKHISIAPAVRSVTPNTGPSLGGGGMVLEGINFGNKSFVQVNIGGYPAAILSSTPASIHVQIPPLVGTSLPIELLIDGKK